jgi:hypothetical protein
LKGKVRKDGWWQPKTERPGGIGCLERRMKEGECQREEIRKYLEKPSRAARQAEIMSMRLEDIEGELAACGWVAKPVDDQPVSEEKLLVGIEETAHAKDASLRRRVERRGTTTSQAVADVRK